MSLLRFFKPKDRLPDPTGALSTPYLPLLYIAQANREVQNPISGDKSKRGVYKKYSAGLRSEIGKYATTNTAGPSVDVLD